MRRSKFELRNSKLEARWPGFTLIELLAVMTLTLLVAGSACVLIAKMLRASQTQADALVRQRTLHLWEAQFKQDGRRAQAAKTEAATPETQRVEFQQASQTVTYQVISGGLERSVNGELGGRWECGAGSWEFSLLEGGHLVRAEFRRAEELSLSNNGQSPKGSPDQPQWTRVRVDVALGVKPVDAAAPEDK